MHVLGPCHPCLHLWSLSQTEAVWGIDSRQHGDGHNALNTFRLVTVHVLVYIVLDVF